MFIYAYMHYSIIGGFTMGFFKSREEKEEARLAQERQLALEEQQEEEERKMEEDRERQEELDECIQEIDIDVRQNNPVICYCTDNTLFKEAAMNYLFKKGYVCVQNDVTSTQYTVHCVLTFVKKEFADSFIVK